MATFNLDKKHVYALLLAFMASVALTACSSSDEASEPAAEDSTQSKICDEMGANQEGGCL